MASDENQQSGENLVGPPLTETPAGPVHPSPGAGASLALAYRGDPWDLFLVMLKNICFTLATLGIYTPWARATRRRYLWRQVDVGGHRLEFTGTGRELLIGYLKVLAGYLVLIGAPQVVTQFQPVAGTIYRIAGILVVVALVPFAIYWSRRYLLTRTRWRGIRFNLAGDARSFAGLWVKGLLLTAVTLGLYGPVFANQIYGFVTRNTRYGTVAFRYDGRDGDAFKISLKGWVLSLLTLGLYYFWYRAELQRFRLAHTGFDRAVGRFEITGGLLLKLTLLNLFGNLLTLGIAIPWTLTATLRALLAGVSFVGPIDFSQVVQSAAAGGDAAGDTLAGALGVELGL